MHIDHVTIRTRDLARTRDFLVNVLELEERARPEVIQRMMPGHWLYADERPLLHLIPSRGTGQDHAAEAFDHVGIHLEGYEKFLKKLDSLKIPHSLMDLPELNERRVFFHTPGGPLLEAVFNEPMHNEITH